jgi:CheY-like chemotaxis protein
VTKQILVVDESSVLVSVTKSLVAGTGAGAAIVDLASSSAAALDLLQQKVYDLLLVNFQTEKLDALDVLRQVRDSDCGTEAVAVAGWLTPQLLEGGRRLGITSFYRLPAEVDELADHLRFA